jgi:regulator of cell morphogenesis and NO signaling
MNITQGLSAKIGLQQHKVDYNSWPIDWLANYIEKLQRKTITEKSKSILENIGSIKDTCNYQNNYFIELEVLFTQYVTRLCAHTQKEEQHLFPFVRKMIQAKELSRCINPVETEKIEGLIKLLNNEHAAENNQLKLSAALKQNYEPTANLNRQVNTLFTALLTFEQAFELHIYLQSNFLFPKIIAAKYALCIIK